VQVLPLQIGKLGRKQSAIPFKILLMPPHLGRFEVNNRLRLMFMGGNGLIVSFGEVMPMRLGRLQRQSRRAFWASAYAELVGAPMCSAC